MVRVLGCIVSEHDLRFVALSLLICLLGSYTTLVIVAGSTMQKSRMSSRRAALAAIVFGSSTWSVHFIATIAFLPAQMIGYDMRLTALSAVVAIGGSWAAFGLWRSTLQWPARVVSAGILLGLAVAAMHYLGAATMRVSVGIIYDAAYVTASIVLGCALSIVALARFPRKPTSLRRAEVTIWLSAAICSLHFIGMAAMTVVPGRAEPTDSVVVGSTTVAIAVGCVSLAVLIAGLIASMVETYVSRFQHQARHDALTGLANRHGLMERLDILLSVAQQQQSSFAVVFLDIDRFKPINDLYGHAAGDDVLVQVARRIPAVLSSKDTLARIGGDEFILLIMTDPRVESVATIATRAITSLREPFFVDGHRLEIDASVGIAVYPNDGATADALLRAADAAMYRAKGDGLGQVRFYEQAMNAQIQADLQIEQELNAALENDELILHFQPIVNSRSGTVETFEALIRWQHPQRGLLQPADFIPLAERTWQIGKIGSWVIRAACREAAAWPQPWRVALNVSPKQFQMSDVCSEVAAALEANALAPARLVVEVTESVLIHDATTAVTMLNRLRQLGVRIALDDFGTGFSSLSYLQLFKFDKFKVDKSFVQKLGENDDALMITRTIVNLGHNLGLEVTAEGVETVEQLELLRGLGCDQIQGYLVARPGPFANWTENDRVRTRELFRSTRLPVPA